MSTHASAENVARSVIGASRPVLQWGAAHIWLPMAWEPALVIVAWIAAAVIVGFAYRWGRK